MSLFKCPYLEAHRGHSPVREIQNSFLSHFTHFIILSTVPDVYRPTPNAIAWANRTDAQPARNGLILTSQAMGDAVQQLLVGAADLGGLVFGHEFMHLVSFPMPGNVWDDLGHLKPAFRNGGRELMSPNVTAQNANLNSVTVGVHTQADIDLVINKGLKPLP